MECNIEIIENQNSRGYSNFQKLHRGLSKIIIFKPGKAGEQICMYFLPGLSPVDIFPPGTSPVDIFPPGTSPVDPGEFGEKNGFPGEVYQSPPGHLDGMLRYAVMRDKHPFLLE